MNKHRQFVFYTTLLIIKFNYAESAICAKHIIFYMLTFKTKIAGAGFEPRDLKVMGLAS